MIVSIVPSFGDDGLCDLVGKERSVDHTKNLRDGFVGFDRVLDGVKIDVDNQIAIVGNNVPVFVVGDPGFGAQSHVEEFLST